MKEFFGVQAILSRIIRVWNQYSQELLRVELRILHAIAHQYQCCLGEKNASYQFLTNGESSYQTGKSPQQ